MSDHNGVPSPRPRPKYGELAPEGWVWRPPADVGRLDTSKPLPPAAPSVESAPNPYQERPGGGPRAGHRVSSWDQPVTIGLLVLGALGMFIAIATLSALPQSIQLLYANNNLGTYRAAPGVGTVILVGQIIQGALWVINAVISTSLMARKRTAFFVPLAAGFVSSVVLVVMIMIIVSSDPNLINYYSTAGS